MKQWMSALPDSRRLCELSLPGTHDSGTAFADFPLISRCQAYTIKEQIELGVRLIDVRLCLDEGELYFVHGAANCRERGLPFSRRLSFDSVFLDLCEFLDKNPNETILLCIKSERCSAEGFYSFFYDKYISANAERFYIKNRLPTLGECRGRLVLLTRNRADGSRFDDENSGLCLCNFPFMTKLGSEVLIKREIPKADEAANREYLIAQDFYTLLPKKKWYSAVLPSLKQTKAGANFLYWNSTSTVGYLCPWHAAHFINKKLLCYLKENPAFYGCIVMDFANEELIDAIIGLN